MRQTLTY
jgi:hypothetical protein